MTKKSDIPLPTLKRFSLYYSLIKKYDDDWISTSKISKNLDLKAITVRKDLNYLGIKGSPQKGFPRHELFNKLKHLLGGESCKDLILIGSWGLGSVYKSQPELISGDYKLRVCFDDVSEENINGPIPIYPLERLSDLIPRLGITIALLSVDPKKAKKMSRELYSSGIKGILNLTQETINSGEGEFAIDFNPVESLSRLLGMVSTID